VDLNWPTSKGRTRRVGEWEGKGKEKGGKERKRRSGAEGKRGSEKGMSAFRDEGP